MRLRRPAAIDIKTPEQLALMREAGLVVCRALKVLAQAVQPGISTADLDAIARQEIATAGAEASFLGYHGYPAAICTSVNEQVVHGIPDPAQRLRAGDVISIDCGAVLDGWHGDSAVTVGVGEISPEDQALLEACETALWRGIAQARPGRRLGDISSAVERSVAFSGRYGLVREYTGHGIGTQMHMAPDVPNFGKAGRGPRLRAGMTLAIEPMITRGGGEVIELADGWTVVSADASRAAHFEHTVAMTPDGPRVLTAEDGGVSRLGTAPAAARQETAAAAPHPAAAPAARRKPDEPASPRLSHEGERHAG